MLNQPKKAAFIGMICLLALALNADDKIKASSLISENISAKGKASKGILKAKRQDISQKDKNSQDSQEASKSQAQRAKSQGSQEKSPKSSQRNKKLTIDSTQKEGSKPLASPIYLPRQVVRSYMDAPFSGAGLGSSATLTRTQIEDGGYTNLADALAHIDGIDIGRIGGAISISIRGSGSASKDSVGILVDGVPLSYQIAAPLDTQGNAEIDAIPLDVIERIEVIKVGANVLAGSGKSGGVINIITKKGDKKHSKKHSKKHENPSGKNLIYELEKDKGTNLAGAQGIVPSKGAHKQAQNIAKIDIAKVSEQMHTKALGANALLYLGLERYIYRYGVNARLKKSAKNSDFSLELGANGLNRLDSFYHGREDAYGFSTKASLAYNRRDFISLSFATLLDSKEINAPLSLDEFYAKRPSRDAQTPYNTKKNMLGIVTQNEVLNRHILLKMRANYTLSDANTSMPASFLAPIPNPKGLITGSFKDKDLNLAPTIEIELPYTRLSLGYEYAKATASRALDADIAGSIKNTFPPITFKPHIGMRQRFSLDDEQSSLIALARVDFKGLRITPMYRLSVVHLGLRHHGNIYKVEGMLPPFFPIKLGKSSSSITKRAVLNNEALEISYAFMKGGRVYYDMSIGASAPNISKYISNDFLSGKLFTLNTGLKNEHFMKNELGIRASFAKGRAKTSMHIAIFDIEKRDEVVSNGVVPRSFYSYNIKATRRSGFEIGLGHEIAGLSLSYGATYINSRVLRSEIKEDVGKSIPFVSALSFKARLAYAFTPHIKMGLSLLYKSPFRASGLYNDGKVAFKPMPPHINVTTSYHEIKSIYYLSLDYNVEARFLGFVMDFGVKNLLKRKNMAGIALMQTGDFKDGTRIVSRYLPGPGATLYMRARYRY